MAEGGIPSADPDISITNRTGGGFRAKIEDVNEICISDFYNPWNFYSLFLQGDSFVVNWCVRNGLLPDRIPCNAKGNCDGVMKLSQRSGRVTGYTLRCMKNRNHECASRKYSFFENCKLTIQDVMVFVKTYLEGNTLYRCSRMCGVHYQSTGVDWGSFVRELFKEHFMRHILTRKNSGEVEIDESLFGRRVKHHRGNPRKGCKIWVFGMVERSSNTVILYPVRDRSQRTLLPLIQRHGWSAYCSLNEAGYRHFTVIHKHTFKSQYRNLETGDTITVHTNRIEGAWKHAKDHFKTIVGTKLSQFEGHLAEVMWRSDVKGKYFEPFFDLVREVYSLHEPPQYTYSTPLFDSWDMNATLDLGETVHDWEVVPTVTDIDDTDSATSTSTELCNEHDDVIVVSSDHEPATVTCEPTTSKALTRTQKFISELFSSTESDSDTELHNATITEVSSNIKKKAPLRLKLKKTKGNGRSGVKSSGARMRTDRVCHPSGYEEIKKTSTRKRDKRGKDTNPYGKHAFVWSSSDSDFA